MTIRLSIVSIGFEDEIEELYLSSTNTIHRLCKRIANLFSEKFKDKTDRTNLICLLKQGVVDPRNKFTSYNKQVLEILNKYGDDFK